MNTALIIDNLQRIITEAGELGAYKCQPAPHACPACEIVHLAQEALREFEHKRHYHVASSDGSDACAACGLDLRNPIHLRLGELDWILYQQSREEAADHEMLKREAAP